MAAMLGTHDETFFRLDLGDPRGQKSARHQARTPAPQILYHSAKVWFFPSVWPYVANIGMDRGLGMGLSRVLRGINIWWY